MKFRDTTSTPRQLPVKRPGLPLKVALWLLDQPHIGKTRSARQLAGNLLKAPARQGVVEAQSRLGQLLCLECGNPRDRRVGIELLRQAARAGDPKAQALSEKLGGTSRPLSRSLR
jgi:TPR repeat protein